MPKHTIPENVKSFQKLWPSYSDFAADAGVEYVTAQLWRYRNSIPTDHWPAILKGAEARGLDVSIDLLFRLRGIEIPKTQGAA